MSPAIPGDTVGITVGVIVGLTVAACVGVTAGVGDGDNPTEPFIVQPANNAVIANTEIITIAFLFIFKPSLFFVGGCKHDSEA
jgi:hypothetical protein